MSTETFNNAVDFGNPGADLFRKHIEAQAYSCPVCKHQEGSSFVRLEISDKNIISYVYSCKYCGEKSSRDFSLNEISMMMKMAARGDEIEFWEIWCMCKFYQSLINNPKKYKDFCNILARPASFKGLGHEEKKSRWTEAWEKLLGGKEQC